MILPQSPLAAHEQTLVDYLDEAAKETIKWVLPRAFLISLMILCLVVILIINGIALGMLLNGFQYGVSIVRVADLLAWFL